MKKLLQLAIFMLATHLTWGQDATDFNGEVLHDYFKVQLEMIKNTPGFTPPVASRALGYTGLGAYEATVHGNPMMNSFVGVLPQLDELPSPDAGVEYNWGLVSNEALFLLVSDLYSNASVEDFAALEDVHETYSIQFSDGTPQTIIEASVQFGTDLANSIIAYSNDDGQEACQFSNFPEEYIIPEGVGLWEPLEGQMALQPYWGEKRCFAVEYVDLSMISPAPPAYSEDPESEMYAEAFAVYDASLNLTQEQLNIAQYWADGGGTYTPPGHSISMLRFILMDEDENLAFSAEAYARLGMALSDAFVACWKTKYEYNLLRPIHYINDVIDETWTTSVGTPPFPEYVSGHSTQSGAFGATLTAIYGNNYAFIDSTYGELHGGPRSFDNFIECAEETAISRLYGGIHYPIGNTEGSSLGIAIGEMVNQLFDQAIVGVDENSMVNLKLYPNPATDRAIISANEMIENIEVYNIQGSLVSFLTPKKPQVALNVETWETGMYLVRVTMNGVTSTERFIKQ